MKMSTTVSTTPITTVSMPMLSLIFFLLIISFAYLQAQQSAVPQASNSALSTATFGGGCFWCIEAVFERVDGVQGAVSGFSGGDPSKTTYKEVSSGSSGHAEVVQITYQPDLVSYETLLKIFFKVHDPTTLNKQGNDVGEQYRSIILYHDPMQQALAKKYIQKIATTYPSPVVTQLQPYAAFYKAEVSHQDYYANNANQPYCRFIIAPKVEKFEKNFSKELKKTPK